MPFTLHFWQFAIALFLVSPNALRILQLRDLETVIGFLLSLMLLLGVARLLAFAPRILMLVIISIGLLTYIDVSHLVDYGTHISVGAVGAMFDSDPKEASEFFMSVSGTAMPLLVAFVLVLGVFTWLLPAEMKQKKSLKYWLLSLFFIALPVINFVQEGAIVKAHPVSTISSGFDYLYESKRLESLLEERKSFSFGASRKVTEGIREQYVLVLGETARRDHLGVYGYGRNTTPFLSARDDILLFTDAISPANQTSKAVKLMLSPATTASADTFYSQGTMISLAKQAGLTTHWLSNQGRYGEFDTEVSSIGREADSTAFTNTDFDTKSRDERLIPHFKQVLDAPSEASFTVVHLLGSHAAYFMRYPKDFDVFDDKPPQGAVIGKVPARLINEYDTSIRYSDYVLNEVIESTDAQNSSACVIYVADHAEVLGESDERIGHGFAVMRDIEAEVPFVVWCSEEFRSHRAENWANLKQNQQKAFSTQHLFDTLADLMRIDFPTNNTQWSLLSPAYEAPAERLMQGADGSLIRYNNP